MSNLRALENRIDSHLLPEEDEYVGYDWQGEGLYGHEYGYLIDGRFVLEEEVPDFIDSVHTITSAIDAIG